MKNKLLFILLITLAYFLPNSTINIAFSQEVINTDILNNDPTIQKIINKDKIYNNPYKSINDNANKQEVNFEPYMRDLQRRIKRNWDPPKLTNSKNYTCEFKILKDGTLKDLKMIKSSGDKETDISCQKAITLSAPFRALPPEYKKNDISIQFTFDYNFNPLGPMYRNK